MTEGPGPVAEEAARLLAALQEWARQRAGPGLNGLGGHMASGSAECRLCPFCQLLSLVRHTNPDALAHLSQAGASLLAAARAALESRDRSCAARQGGGLEHIDIT